MMNRVRLLSQDELSISKRRWKAEGRGEGEMSMYFRSEVLKVPKNLMKLTAKIRLECKMVLAIYNPLSC